MTSIQLHEGDNRLSLRRLIDQGVRVHSVVTDPPYGLVSIQKRFGKDGAAAARTNGNDGSFARMSGGFMGKCFHPDTEILTDRGWRRVADVQIGDIVATLNPTSRDLEWQAVEQTHAYPFKGELVHVKHRSAEQMVTPNHRIVVSHDGGSSLELVEPMRTKTHFHLFSQANPVTGIKGKPVTISSEREYGSDSRIVYDTSTFDAPAFFRFFGLWLGDGYTCTRTGDHPANDFFGFTVKKERKVAAIRRTLLDLKIKFTETPSRERENTTFYCYDFALLGFLKTIGKAADKHIPAWMFDRDASELEELYQGLIETDGCRQGKDQEVYHTTSRQLSEDFQRICLHTGRSAISVFKPGGELVNICGNETVSSDSWSLCVLQPGKRLYGERSSTSSNVIFEDSYAGFVYCVGVPKHHILYTRFNGKPVWSGNSWDGSGIERDPEFWKLIYEILLPGGYVFAFSGSRTGHWQACAMEMAGFIMHPMHGWAFGSGFPKAHAADKAIDKAMGAKGTYEGVKPGHADFKGRSLSSVQSLKGTMGGDGGFARPWMDDAEAVDRYHSAYVPGSPEAAEWEGWAYGTQAQKPALEPIYLGQKPFSEKTGAANLLKHGVGAVNIDGCRVPSDGGALVRPSIQRHDNNVFGKGLGAGVQVEPAGRHPANLILDGSDEVVGMFPATKSGTGAVKRKSSAENDGNSGAAYGAESRPEGTPMVSYGDEGSAARFFHHFPPDMNPLFYHPKAGKADRAGSKHPTVKPIALMQYLIRHITPPGGVVLDPFAGSGTTGEAAKREGFDCILMEAEQEYIDFLHERFELGSDILDLDDPDLLDI